MGAWVVEQRRGGTVEARHPLHACVADATGRLLFAVGSDLETTFRSAAKPFQLESSLALLPALDTQALSAADLALGSASHHGEPAHVQGLSLLLSKLGRTPQHLYCGAHEPLSAESARALQQRAAAADVLHNNCAGKHAFMAAASAAQGYPEDYRPAAHPLQVAIRERLALHSGCNLSSVVDGCGVPCFVLPLSGMARAYAQLAVAVGQDDGAWLGRIGRALRAEPWLMSGAGAFDGWLMQSTPLVAKIGAQGLLCAALPERGLGLAIKLESGVDLARPVACAGVLARVLPGLLPELPERFYALRNVAGERVGELALACDA